MTGVVPTKQSLDIVEHIAANMQGNTFHHHFHILYDIRDRIDKPCVDYLEIGTHSGGSACLMLSSPKPTHVVGIDLGTWATPDIVTANVEKFGLKSNRFDYIIGDSRDPITIKKVKVTLDQIDILFIDGGHAYPEVIADYLNYNGMVSTGGYIVFDDYHDWEYSAQVKHAIDHIVDELLFDQFDVIGTVSNAIGATPKEKKHNNLFILRKR